jgi:hypothetical protein
MSMGRWSLGPCGRAPDPSGRGRFLDLRRRIERRRAGCRLRIGGGLRHRESRIERGEARSGGGQGGATTASTPHGEQHHQDDQHDRDRDGNREPELALLRRTGQRVVDRLRA